MPKPYPLDLHALATDLDSLCIRLCNGVGPIQAFGAALSVAVSAAQALYGIAFELNRLNNSRESLPPNDIYRTALERIGSGLGNPACAVSTMSQVAREALESAQQGGAS